LEPPCSRKGRRHGRQRSYGTLDILIDTDIDKPTVVISPPNNGTTLGGSFMVSGGATDNNFIYKVYMQVEVVGGAYTDHGTIARSMASLAS
jgi:hypothetical protein